MVSVWLRLILVVAFIWSGLGPLPLAAADDFRLPLPGSLVTLSSPFQPPVLSGIKVFPKNPFQIEFILDQGDSALPTRGHVPLSRDASPRSSSRTLAVARTLPNESAAESESTPGKSPDALKQEANKLIKYFLASLTIPEKDLWVNLSPYEKDRIIPDAFGKTEMGRDLLAEDYMLKQITSSLIYPEGETGKKFWKKVYAEAVKRFGTTNIPVNTFNKVWIVPEKAIVYENAKVGTAYVVESTLKVMLEEDYLSQAKHGDVGVLQNGDCPVNIVSQGTVPILRGSNIHMLGSQMIREIVIPELTKEVNTGANFAKLRQVYNSLILATWYKKKIKDSILTAVYANKNKIQGITITTPGVVEVIYRRYLQAFKKGVYNFIKDEQDPITHQPIPRKYFSGGVDVKRMDAAMAYEENRGVFKSISPAGKSSVLVDLASIAPDQSDKSTPALPSEQETNGVEKAVMQALHIDASEVFVTRAHLGAQSLPIKWLEDKQAHRVKYFREGPFIVVHDDEAEGLDAQILKYPFLIKREMTLLDYEDNLQHYQDSDIYFDNPRGIYLYGGYTMGVLAGMIFHADRIKGTTFMDLGAGPSGLLAVAAERLGASKIILVDRDPHRLDSLLYNIELNVKEDQRAKFHLEHKDISEFLKNAEFPEEEQLSFVVNVRNYGIPYVLQAWTNYTKRINIGFSSGGTEIIIPTAVQVLDTLLHIQPSNVIVVGPQAEYTTLVLLPHASPAMITPLEAQLPGLADPNSLERQRFSYAIGARFPTDELVEGLIHNFLDPMGVKDNDIESRRKARYATLFTLFLLGFKGQPGWNHELIRKVDEGAKIWFGRHITLYASKRGRYQIVHGTPEELALIRNGQLGQIVDPASKTALFELFRLFNIAYKYDLFKNDFRFHYWAHDAIVMILPPALLDKNVMDAVYGKVDDINEESLYEPPQNLNLRQLLSIWVSKAVGSGFTMLGFSRGNRAQLSADNGGIDFSSDQTLSIQNNGGPGIALQMDPAQLAQWRTAVGVKFTIVKIQSMTSLQQFLS